MVNQLKETSKRWRRCEAVTNDGTRCRNKGSYFLPARNIVTCGVHKKDIWRVKKYNK